MFGLFKRTKVETWETELLRYTIEKLPKEYSSLISQITDGLFRGVLVDVSDITGYVAFTFNHDVLKKYDKEGDKDYKLTNIKVYDNKSSGSLPYEIYISSGTISGYSLGGSKKRDIDLSKIDVSSFKKELVGESDYNRIVNLLNDEEKTVVSPSEVYSVFVGDEEYFHLKDLEDGDFIGMDAKKIIYKITHDPMEVNRVDKTLKEILS
ncbi:hypothetical protein GCM10007049_35670 [Echinicola pacifica]|uniref:Uncharacterized protein n=1 Tax=Echinicola pacifica TaxID=346377 RepID=A0A918UWM0_9BACT|nr:hypothetical protein [Echinicola pacifica]GGZ39182.1 hypothetical protein GCM10007049_35670 [Echinicola pacifica]